MRLRATYTNKSDTGLRATIRGVEGVESVTPATAVTRVKAGVCG